MRTENTRLLRKAFVALEHTANCEKNPDPTLAKRSATFLEYFDKIRYRVRGKGAKDIDEKLVRFKAATQSKVGGPEVCAAVNALKQSILKAYKVAHLPSQTPEYEVGRQVFQRTCQSCHGVKGVGNGPLASNPKSPMKPAPSDFAAADKALASPFRYMNVLLVGGRPNSAMGSFDDLHTSHELWSAAFYLIGLRHETVTSRSKAASSWEKLGPEAQKQLAEKGLDLELLTFSSDQQLKLWLSEIDPKGELGSHSELLALLRLGAAFDPALARKSP